MYDDAIARGVPISAETLLSNSMKLGSDVVSGGKEIRTMGVDLESGKVRYSYALNSRENYSDMDDNSTSNLIIKRTTRVVRAVEATSGQERWNVTVGEYELLIPKNERSDFNRCVCPINAQELKDEDELENFSSSNPQLEYRLSPADGLIVAYDKANPYEPVWTHQLTSPIAQLWSINEKGINEISLFNPQVVPYLQADNAQQRTVANIRGSDMILYIGTYQNEKYVIPSPEERRRLQTFVFTHQYMPSDASRLYLAANAFDLNKKQPAIIEDENDDEQCMENLPTCSSREVNSLILKDNYPRDMGWYLFKQNDKQATKRLWYAEKFNFARHLWLFIILPTSFIACAIPFFVKKLRHFDIQVVNTNLKSIGTAEAITPSSSNGTIVRPVEESKLDTQQHYESWYLNHFDPIRCLGKGGFGVVIESLNKLDQQIYAVKRISVSNK
uniref:Protein kinase domain-containing protein n=1 Tax=Romanomermis culicivorax TaxID=13658 RepID=A0A915KKW0_ROMCU